MTAKSVRTKSGGQQYSFQQRKTDIKNETTKATLRLTQRFRL